MLADAPVTATANLTLVLQVVEIISITAGAVGVILRGGKIALQVGAAVERFQLVGEQHGRELSQLKTEVTALKEVIVQVAVQNQRLDSMENRVQLLDSRFEELRHGRGLVVNRNDLLGSD